MFSSNRDKSITGIIQNRSIRGPGHNNGNYRSKEDHQRSKQTHPSSESNEVERIIIR